MAHRGHAKKIQVVHWTGFAVSDLTQSSGTAAAIQLFGAQHLPETHLRLRGCWSAVLVGAQATGVAVSVVAGIILVPEGTGTTVLWSPGVDADAPWIWWDCFQLLYEESVVDTVASPTYASRIMDSKSMRHIRNQETQMVVENNVISSTSAIRWSADGRVLAGS